MSLEAETTGVIDQLTADLRPVRRVPSMRVAIGALLMIEFAVVSIAWLSGMAALSPIAIRGDVGFYGLMVSLMVLAVGGSMAGLAAATPGREQTMRLGWIAASVGLGAAALSSVFATGARPDLAFGAPETQCLLASVTFGLAPIAAGTLLVWRSWSGRPWRTSAGLLLGTTALGALAVQMVCPVGGTGHVLLSHCSAPLLVAMLGSLVVAPLLARRDASVSLG